MKIAGGVIALLAGIFGCIAAVVTLFFGGLGAAFSVHNSSTVIGLGWGGIFFSFVVIVLGACAIGTKSRAVGWLIIISAIGGAILGGTIVAVCMVLALVGGILALIGTKPGYTVVPNIAVQPNSTPSNTFCTSCGNALQAGVAFCPSCGNKQQAATPQSLQPIGLSTGGATVVNEYGSYSQVPWYRKNWFAILCFFVLSPALLIILATGSVYYLKNGQVRKYSNGAKGFLIVYCSLAIIVAIASVLKPSQGAASSTQTEAQQDTDSPIQKLIKASPSDLSPSGELAKTFELGGDSTDLQRDNLLAKIKGQVVQWKLPVYEVSKTDDGYRIQTQDNNNTVAAILNAGTNTVGTFSEVTALSDEDRAYIANLKTGDYVTIKGVINDVTMRNIDLDPAIVIIGNSANAASNNTGAGAPSTQSDASYTDGSGNKYQLMVDSTGGTLISSNATIHLGKACGATSPQLGTGTWDWGNGGFVAHFPNGKDIGFPRQEIDVGNNDGCSNEPSDNTTANTASKSFTDDAQGKYQRYKLLDGSPDNSGSATIILAKSEQGQWSITGDAEFDSESSGTNVGNVDGPLLAQGGALIYNKDGCSFIVQATGGQITLSNDNGSCGGMNVSFNGNYRKQTEQSAPAPQQAVVVKQAATPRQTTRVASSNTGASEQEERGKLEAANSCFTSKNYDCSIQIAKSILAARPNDRRAESLLQRSEDAQKQALHSNWNIQ